MKHKMRKALSSNLVVPGIFAQLGVIVLMGLIFLGPLFSGLFFEKKILTFGIITFILLFYVFVAEGWKNKVTTMLALALIALTALYWTSVPGAVNKGAAIIVALRYSIYLAIYILVITLVKSTGQRLGLIATIWGSAVLVAFLGLSTFTGLYTLQAGIDDAGRITSTIQYANSLAAFLSIGLIIGFTLFQRTKQLSWQLLINSGNVLMMVALVGTQSRGGWLVSGLIFIFLFILYFKERAFQGLTAIIISFFSAALTVQQFGASGPNPGLLIWLALALVINIAGVITLYYFSRAEKLSITLSKVGVGLVIVMLLTMGLMFFKYDNSVPIIARAKAISLKERNVIERGYFYKDALSMIADRPIKGYGGDGWKTEFKQYQSYYYLTSEVHNHFLQLAVEIGLPGLLLFFTAWLGFLKNCILARKEAMEREQKLLWGTVALAGIGLGLHSMIDFNLSLSALAIILWALFGLSAGINNHSGESNPAAKGTKMYYQGAGAIISIVLLILTIKVITGIGYAEQAVTAMAQGNYPIAESNFAKAISNDPYRAEYYADKGRILLNKALKLNSKELLKQALPSATRATELNQGSADYRSLRAKILLGLEQLSEASYDANQAIKLNPWEINNYEFSSDLNLQIGEYYLTKQEPALAKEYLKVTAEMPERITGQIKLLNSTTRNLWDRSKLLGISPDIEHKARRAKLLLEKY
jgi:O-antigen ligase